MAAYLSRLHHISLQVSNVDKVAHELVSRFQFNVFAARRTDRAKQLALRRGSAVFVVNERPSLSDCGAVRDHRDAGCVFGTHEHYPVDTVSNVCFEVTDVPSASRALRDQDGCEFLQPPAELQDDRGRVTFSIVRSPVGNVCHTLIDSSRYQGPFLPGFREVSSGCQGADRSRCPITHFDHITYACPRSSTVHITNWYRRNFGFQRFFIDRNEDVDEGYVLNHDGIGLRLTAMEYWKCSESGIKLPFKDEKEPDCKFVIAESLPEQGRNQVDTFLDEHRGAGIQHIGLYTEDIVKTAQTLSQAGVQFFSPPPAYYTEVGKQQEMLDAGYDPQTLSRYGILLDTDIQTDTDRQTTDGQRHLLQVFTKPVFAEDTFFLELIERRGATGFGEGNIRALWRSVQAYMENGEHQERQSNNQLSKQR
ncbi:4-hydroxyphenylpyruvate dioxygenase-like protein isoform X1 [Danio rerio]|uniref:4-hydroxyphenylpyruvate dioxygenase-like protein isoform X1 n=1 Tax=Danio rerio TaxID=7955 RepID=A0AC58GVP2_DANRE|nr:4-hydroxyphenylpyruvate dioxygenase-like protein [Danio rerio]|eukprot:XP_021326749.1 4-hydroxyphenylpyruvate dioxygenase-like protein [Danio rerio]